MAPSHTVDKSDGNPETKNFPKQTRSEQKDVTFSIREHRCPFRSNLTPSSGQKDNEEEEVAILHA
jgi:hypothetical protein